MENVITPHPVLNPGGKEFVPNGTEYQLKLGAATAIPAVYMPDAFFKRPRVFYQQQEPDCGANAGAFAAAIVDEHPQQEYSPDYQWIDIKTFDGFAASDGTDMKSIFKSLGIGHGSIPYAMLPEQTDLPLATFSSANRITAAMKTEAGKHIIAAYAFQSIAGLNMATLKNLIYTHGAVVILIRIGAEFWTDKDGVVTWAENKILPLDPTKYPISSGHFVVLGAYDENNVYFVNWWSEAWGRGGYGYFQANYIPRILQIGTVVDSLESVTLPEFTRDLTIGSTGPDVTALQRYLNQHGYQVAATGPGSKGQETNYFGTLTRDAVSKLQKVNGISPTAGYFGQITRQFVNNHQ